MHPRTRAREIALQFLYQIDLRGEDGEGLEAFLAAQGGPGAALEYARILVGGVTERRAEIDAAIAAVAEHWSLARMAAVDRSVLRIGAWELLFTPDVPPVAAINEAVDLAKKFSSADSGAFVNGLLDKIRLNEDGGHHPSTMTQDA